MLQAQLYEPIEEAAYCAVSRGAQSFHTGTDAALDAAAWQPS